MRLSILSLRDLASLVGSFDLGNNCVYLIVPVSVTHAGSHRDAWYGGANDTYC